MGKKSPHTTYQLVLWVVKTISSWSCPSTPSMSVWQSLFSLAASTLPTSGSCPSPSPPPLCTTSSLVAALTQGRHQHTVSVSVLLGLLHSSTPHLTGTQRTTQGCNCSRGLSPPQQYWGHLQKLLSEISHMSCLLTSSIKNQGHLPESARVVREAVCRAGEEVQHHHYAKEMMRGDCHSWTASPPLQV
jgi:hypothetical protein